MADYVRKLHDLERENTTLKLNMDEVQHNSKRDVANFKLEMVKERGEHNRAKELLHKQIEGSKSFFLVSCCLTNFIRSNLRFF